MIDKQRDATLERSLKRALRPVRPTSKEGGFNSSI